MFRVGRRHYCAATPGPAILALGAGTMAGAMLALQWPAPLPGWLSFAAAFTGLAALMRGHLFAAGLLLGLALTGWGLTRALADRLDPVLDGTHVEFVGIVEDLPRREARRLILNLRIESPAGLPGRARISWYEPGAVPRPGERWRFVAKLQRPRGLINTGGASREAWLLRQRVGATGYATGAAAGELLVPAANRWLDLRGRSAARIEAAVPDSRQAAVLTAIALGFRGGLDSQALDALAATGTGHLLAISGLHVGLAAAGGALLGGLLARALGIRRRPIRDFAAGGALLVAFAYCMLAGMPVSARRAVLMTAAGLVALVSRRRSSLLAAFGGALALVLAADPLATLDPGLWLSFGAVASILAVVAGRRRAPAKWLVLLRIQVALGVGLVACTVAWFGRISMVAPVANLFAVPWFSLLVVPPALAGVLLSWPWPAAGAMLFKLAGEATRLAFIAIEGFAGFSHASHAVAAPGLFAISCASLGAAWLLLPRPAPGRPVAMLLFAPLLLNSASVLPPGAFELRVMDVGHGLAVFVRTRHRLLLYDTGPAWPGGDAGSRTVLPAMRALGLERLNALVVSHGHADHAGGMAAIRDAWPTTPAWGGHGVQAEGIRPCKAGLSWGWDGVRFSVLHPPAGFRGGQNDGSCVLLIEGPGGRALLAGDIEAVAERSLLRRWPVLPVDLIVVPHHGSRSSSTPELVLTTRPAWALVSTGWGNRWGFPAPDVVERWRKAGAIVLSTDRQGEISIRFTAHGPEPPVSGRYRECRVWLACASGEVAAR
jgi:competence protein ComEC